MRNYKLKSKLDALRQKADFGFEFVKTARDYPEWPKLLNKTQNYTMFLAGIFLMLLVVVGLSELARAEQLKKQVLGEATVGYELFGSAKQGILDSDLRLAGENFALASQSFARARGQINDAGGVVGQLVKILPQGVDLDRILRSASHVSEALDLSTSGFSEFSNSKLSWDSQTNSSDIEFFRNTKTSRAYFIKSEAELDSALALLSAVNPNSLPSDLIVKYQQSLVELNLAKGVISNLVSLQDVILELLGGEAKTYLLMFQNNNEARATGGFIGTYGTLHFENGRMKIGKIESIYHLEGQLQTNIVPPVPIARLLNNRWGIHDSNWFVDFPTSARKFIEFYELTTGQLADGVIAMTPNVFEELLAITGPIEMGEYGETLDSQNFRAVVQFKTSTDYDRAENRPKKFLSDFTPKLLTRFSALNPDQFLEVFDTMLQMVSEKEIMLFSLDQDLQSKLSEFGATGKIQQTDGDYLGIFHSNVGGGKTDLGISTKVEKEVKISVTGVATVKLSITREHQGFTEREFPKNVDYMRILVPLGSNLMTAAGFDQVYLDSFRKTGYAKDREVDFWQSQQREFKDTGVSVGSEAFYTEFAGWLELDPGQKKTVSLEYKLPFVVSNLYTEVLQKQPGSRAFDYTLRVDHGRELLYSYPERFENSGSTSFISRVVVSDRIHALVIK